MCDTTPSVLLPRAEYCAIVNNTLVVVRRIQALTMKVDPEYCDGCAAWAAIGSGGGFGGILPEALVAAVGPAAVEELVARSGVGGVSRLVPKDDDMLD